MHIIELGSFVAEGFPTLTVDEQRINAQKLMFTYWSYAEQPALYGPSVTVEDGDWPTPAGDDFEMRWNGQQAPARVYIYRQGWTLTVSIGWPKTEPQDG
jgi:hypothetical protein